MTAVGGPCFPGIYWFVDGEGWTHVWAVEEGRGEEQGGEGFVLCVCVVWVWPRVT